MSNVNEHDLHETLRQDLHHALRPGPGYPSQALLDRVMWDVSGHSRSRRARRTAWSPAAALVVLALVGGLLFGQGVQLPTGAGRVEFAGSVEFISSQAHLADEYKAMTGSVLSGFNGTPDFNSQATGGEDIQRIRYEQQVGRTTVDVVALAHGDMLSLKDSDSLEDLRPLLSRLEQDRSFPGELLDYARFGTGKLYYIPWLQATYVMVVNRRALQYLPPGADVMHLTYDQLVLWGERMRDATGRSRIGLPAKIDGVKGGLIYRFMEGYAYPSFTGTMVTGFASSPAVSMWQTMRDLWDVTDPNSTEYDNMSTPLIDGDVWVAWDHQARLAKALTGSDQFIAVPAPSGPAGRGYLSAVVGLAIPKGAPNQHGAEALIDWLTRPRQQAAASASLSFFPAVHGVELHGPQAEEQGASNAYQADPRRVEALLPAGLGARTDDVTEVYLDTFSRIVLQGEDIPTVLRDEARQLQAHIDEVRAPCWPPDPPSQGPCRVG
jgi:multiple sugar transport system substrate-binding protein